jgi:hypothetical protein
MACRLGTRDGHRHRQLDHSGERGCRVITLWVPLAGLLHLLVGSLMRAIPEARHRRLAVFATGLIIGALVLGIALKTAETTGWPR